MAAINTSEKPPYPCIKNDSVSLYDTNYSKLNLIYPRVIRITLNSVMENHDIFNEKTPIQILYPFIK
jgi:hypothetical protein